MDGSQIQGGLEGLNYFSNVGVNEWALLIDHVMYDNTLAIDTDDKSIVHTKLALIDSGNSSIQFPKQEFRKI